MPNPTRQWDQMPVFGWWDIKPNDQLLLEVPQRVRRLDGRMVYPGGKAKLVTVGKTEDQDPAARSEVRAAMRARDEAAAIAASETFDGTAWDVEWDANLSKAVFLYFYLTDDVDMTPNGWPVKVWEKFAGNVGRQYEIYTWSLYLANEIPGINLSLMDPPPGSPTSPGPMYAVGQPGGIAGLSINGFPMTADGVELDPDGLGGGASTVDELTDATPVGRAVVKATTAAVARGAIDAAATTDARFTDQRVPTDGSVSLAKLTALLQASIAKADASLNQAQVDARVQNIVGAAPAALDTLVELSAALGNDANFAATITTALAGKASTALATTAAAGLIELATTTETTTGTDPGLAVTPAGLKVVADTKGAKSETAGYRFRIDASTWEPRPTGYKFVIAVGADPSPVDQQPNDQRWIPVT